MRQSQELSRGQSRACSHSPQCMCIECELRKSPSYMYAKWGNLIDAHQVFGLMPQHSWSSLILAYSKQRKSKEVMKLYYKMQEAGEKPERLVFIAALKACSCLAVLEQGKQVHAHIIERGFQSDVFVANSIVSMYAKCGSIKQARQVFNKMIEKDVASWNGMITGYAQQAQSTEALLLFEEMQQDGLKPDNITYLSILKACTSLKDLQQGKQIHVRIIESGFGSDVFVGSTLVDMYAKCGSIEEAYEVFCRMPQRNVVSWNAIIGGCAQQGYGKEALMLFEQMQNDGVKPDGVTFVSVIKACGITVALKWGRQVHAYIAERGLESNLFVGSALIDMYAKCGCIEDARSVFNRMTKRDIVSWTAMISGYVQQGYAEVALTLFEQMQCEGINPDSITVMSILKACASLADLQRGKELHAYIIKCGFGSNVSVGSTLIDMYSKCGSIKDAHLVFSKMPKRDVVSWTAMMAGFSEHGHEEEALALFAQMQNEGVKPNNVTFSVIVKACCSIGALEKGKQIHAFAIESGFESDTFVGSTLIDMYAKSGKLEDARQLFDRLCTRDAVSWTVMISGYVQQGYGKQALALFDKMQCQDVQPSSITLVSVLKACTSLKSLEQGKRIHALAIESGFELNIFVASSLVDMYAKCGRMDDARIIFYNMHEKDTIAWTAMISGCVQQGHSEEALALFEEMQQKGMNPDSITFASIIKACNNLAALEKGKQLHALLMKSEFESDLSVGNALIDMYAKCGSIQDALHVFDRMSDRDAVSWNAIIAGYAHQGHAKEAITLLAQMRQKGMKPDDVTFICVLSACSRVGLVDEGRDCFESMNRIDAGSEIPQWCIERKIKLESEWVLFDWW